MKANLFLLSAGFIGITVFSVLGNPRRSIVKIHFRGIDQATIHDFLKLYPDILNQDRMTEAFEVLCTEEELHKYEKLGLITENILADADAYAKELRDSDYLSHFRTYNEMVQEMRDIVAKYSDIAKMLDIGDSYEKTVGMGGYDIWVVKISDNVEIEEGEPEVFYMANMHAREIITPEIIMYFMNYLVDNYGTDPYVTYLVNNRQIWLCPSFNPDGHEYVFSGTNLRDSGDPLWWRKNKQDNNKNGLFEPDYDGVDLNRNFGYMWGHDDLGSSPYPGSDTYRGTGPFSEPESQAIRDFVEAHHFIISLSFHSYSQLWLYPWGYANVKTPDDHIFAALADCCTAYNSYIPGTGFGLYPVNGDTDDWLYGEQETKNKIFAFTPEVGSATEGHPLARGYGFHPDTSFINKQIVENLGPQLFLLYAAGEEPIIETEPLADAEHSDGPYAVIARISSPIVLTQPYDLDSTTFRVFYNTTANPPFDSVTMVSAGATDYFKADIPGPQRDATIYYYIQARDVIGRTGHFPRAAPTRLLSFNVGTDRIPPIISHEALPDQSILSPSFIFAANVTDNRGIARVQLVYKRNGSLPDTLDMKLAQPDDDVYEVSILHIK